MEGVTEDMLVLTMDDGYVKVKDLIDSKFLTIVNGYIHNSTDKGFFSVSDHKTNNNKKRKIYEISTENGFIIRGSKNHQIMVDSDWKPLFKIVVGDYLTLDQSHNSFLLTSKVISVKILKDKQIVYNCEIPIGRSFVTKGDFINFSNCVF